MSREWTSLTGRVSTQRLINCAGFLACAGLIAYALYAQHALDLEPCPLCIFQRIGVCALGLIFLVAASSPARGWASRIYIALIGLASLATAGIAARHLYVQSLPTGAVPSCGAPLDALLRFKPLVEVVRDVLIGGSECQEVSWSLLGLAMPGWVLISTVLLGVVGIIGNGLQTHAE